MAEVAWTSDGAWSDSPACTHPPQPGSRTMRHPPTHPYFGPLPAPPPSLVLVSREHLQRDLQLHPQSVAGARLQRFLRFSAPSPGEERKAALGLEVLLVVGGGVPWSLRQMGEVPVGRTWMNFWEETMYHPLSLAAIQCFLPPVSLLILLIYLKELRKRRGLWWGGPYGGSDTRPPRLAPRGAIQRGLNLIFLQIVCQKQQGK